MSGFAVVFDRANTPVDPGVLVRMMEKLSHRAIDGQDIWTSESVAMGHLHFWTTPEEVGEHQPLKLDNLPYTIVLDGRLDNRAEVIGRLNLNVKEAREFSDAAIFLHTYDRWGADGFQYLIGEFAVVIFDARKHELFCARDAVGERSMFYAFEGTRILIGSEPWAVVSGMGRTVEIDERGVAHHFALRIPEDGQTLFKGINELMPAHWQRIGVDSHQLHKYWQPSIPKRSHQKSEQEYIEEFRETLETSVKCRLRSVTKPGVMMSGGLDSTSVAGLAAKATSPEQLTTISYVFDKFNTCDEREYINDFQGMYQTCSIQVTCDDVWPYRTWPEWPLDPSWSPANPYRLILERTYAKAHDEGLNVLLTGMYGDSLYRGAENWLADLFLDMHWVQLSREIKHLFKNHGFVKTISSRFTLHTLKEILLAIPGTELIRRSSTAPNWLTVYGASFLTLKRYKRDVEKAAGLFNLRNASGNSRESYFTNRHGIELRNPYHDRRMLEFFMRLPGYLLYSQGNTKHVLRLAMKEVLPESVRQRTQHTNLLSFYNYGVKQRNSDIQKSLEPGGVAWKKYVKTEEVLKEWKSEITIKNDGAHTTLPSLCIFYDIWYKSFSRGF